MFQLLCSSFFSHDNEQMDVELCGHSLCVHTAPVFAIVWQISLFFTFTHSFNHCLYKTLYRLCSIFRFLFMIRKKGTFYLNHFTRTQLMFLNTLKINVIFQQLCDRGVELKYWKFTFVWFHRKMKSTAAWDLHLIHFMAYSIVLLLV